MPLNMSGIFPPGREINITFDWIEVASATGYVSYDCYCPKDSTATRRLLIETQNKSGLRSKVQETVGTVTAPNMSKGIDLDFDCSPFQLPRVVMGVAYFNFAYYVDSGAGVTSYVVVKVRKWDGATETDIVSVQSANKVTAVATLETVAMNVTIPQTPFKKGEQLRITIEVWGQIGAGSADLYLAGDPSDAAGTYIGAGYTRIISVIPFKVEA